MVRLPGPACGREGHGDAAACAGPAGGRPSPWKLSASGVERGRAGRGGGQRWRPPSPFAGLAGGLLSAPLPRPGTGF